MKNTTSKFEDFQAEKLNKNQQKAILGGGGEQAPPPVDPGKGGGVGSGNG